MSLALALAIISSCGASRGLSIDRWSIEPMERAPDLIMQLIENAGDRTDWPNAHTVTVVDFDSTFFYPDGNQVSAHYSLIKLMTMKSTKDYGTIPLAYDTQQMTIDIVYVRVIYPDSSVAYVTEDDITDETMDTYAGMDIYWSNLRQKVIHLPELQVGCAIEFALRIETVQPMLDDMMDARFGFQSSEPIMRTESKLVVPISETMNWKVFNDPEGKVQFAEKTVKDSLRVYHWWGEGFEPLVSEDAMPDAGEFLTKVLASNTTWEEYSQRVYELSKPNMVADDAIRETVADLMKDAESDYDSIRSIAIYAAQVIRYIGISLGDKEGITPHDVRKTFQAQSGVCKDKSALLAVMLNEAGFESYVALSNPMQHVFYDVASNQFNHMIVVAYDRAGNEIWMDPTDALSMDLLPAYHMNKAVLICKEGGDDLRYLPVLPPETQSGSITAESRIEPNGDYIGKVTITGKGIYDQLLRLIFQQMEATQQQRFWTEMIKQQVHPSARLTDYSISPSPIENLWEAVIIEIEYEIPDYAIVAGDYLLVRSPLATGAFDIMGLVLGQTVGLAERNYPLNIQFTLGSESRETITLPGGYTSKSLPEIVRMDNDAAEFFVDYTIDGNTITYESSFNVKQPQIPPEDYPDYRNTIRKSSAVSQGMIILTEEGGAL